MINRYFNYDCVHDIVLWAYLLTYDFDMVMGDNDNDDNKEWDGSFYDSFIKTF